MSGCPRRMRHWRVAFGSVGIRTPVCLYCGSPNPRPLTDEEWDTLIDWVEHTDIGQGRHVRLAIAEHKSGVDIYHRQS